MALYNSRVAVPKSDGATLPNGAVTQNAKGRLACACTGGTPGCGRTSQNALITNLGFGYSSRGEITDTYTWNEDSNGWYHANQSYRQLCGLPYQLNFYNNSGGALITTITYGADAESRVNQVLD